MKGSLWESLEEIERLIRSTRSLAIFLDFDGTLVPIQADPDRVSLDLIVSSDLEMLVRKNDVLVAIISGRELDDLRNRIAIPGVIYAGNHGLEISTPTGRFVEPTALEHCDTLNSLSQGLADKLLSISGARVEDKGLSTSIHYRQVAEDQCEEVRRVVHGALANANHPFHLTTGNKVFDIRPRVYWHKGNAVAWIREQLAPDSLAIYIGDDSTDEDAFGALPNDITVKVGEGKDSLAQYHLDGPDQVHRFISWLVDQRPE